MKNFTSKKGQKHVEITHQSFHSTYLNSGVHFTYLESDFTPREQLFRCFWVNIHHFS